MWVRPTLWDLLKLSWDEVSGSRHRREIRDLLERTEALLKRLEPTISISLNKNLYTRADPL